MIATHTMKINGVIYRAGEEIPSLDAKPARKIIEKSAASVEKTYNKSDIMTMKAADLRELASENGVENPDELTGNELKKILVEKFGL